MSEAKQATKQINPDVGTAQKPDIAPLQRNAATLLELSNNSWRVTVAAGINPTEIDNHSTFWNHLFDVVREGDFIQALTVDRKFTAGFVVADASFGRVTARLIYAVGGVQLQAVGAAKPVPAGYRIERTSPGGPGGWIVIREHDNFVIQSSGGLPWKSYQEAYESFLKHAIFQTAEGARYVP